MPPPASPSSRGAMVGMVCRALVGLPTADVTYHDSAWYGSWAAVWHYVRAWVTPLRGRQLARLGPALVVLPTSSLLRLPGTALPVPTPLSAPAVLTCFPLGHPSLRYGPPSSRDVSRLPLSP